MAKSIFWYDLETFGIDPQRDRICQFAGVRTDLDLNIIDDPVTLYCQPFNDMLPHPEACLVTGITPQKAQLEGVIEKEFIACINRQFMQPETCVAGYNSIRFDDEMIRNLLYRNFYDPYEREWKNSNSRWDIIDMVRSTCALRPEGIEWPVNEESGSPSFRLELLTKQNGISHESAHDAMSDVYATIAVAKLIKEKQPRLYDYFWQHRSKRSLQPLFDLPGKKPVLHVSSKYPSTLGCCAMVAPLCRHPKNTNGIIVYDLRANPEELARLTAEQIGQRLFVAQADLPEGVSRIPLKTIHLNKCPAVMPAQTLSTISTEKLANFQLDGDQLRAHLKILREIPGLSEKVGEVFAKQEFTLMDDPDLMIYSGGFFSDHDRALREEITKMASHQLAGKVFPFEDARLDEMLMRYKGRNFPDILTEEEAKRWEEYRIQRLNQTILSGLTLNKFFDTLQHLTQSSSLKETDRFILEELQIYGESLLPYDNF